MYFEIYSKCKSHDKVTIGLSSPTVSKYVTRDNCLPNAETHDCGLSTHSLSLIKKKSPKESPPSYRTVCANSLPRMDLLFKTAYQLGSGQSNLNCNRLK